MAVVLIDTHGFLLKQVLLSSRFLNHSLGPPAVAVEEVFEVLKFELNLFGTLFFEFDLPLEVFNNGLIGFDRIQGSL